MPTEHVLIIDDSIAIASLLANEILPLGGYRATAALSGEEGLEVAREIHPDLILCDLEMPGIDGLDVLKSLQSEGLNIPATMMTAFGSEAVAARALRMGVKDYIIKPFSTDEILAAVERALTESRLRRQVGQMQASLDGQQRMLVVIKAVSREAEKDQGPEDILSRVLMGAVYGGKADGGLVALMDPRSRQLRVEVTANLPAWDGKLINVESSAVLTTAIKTGEVVRSKSNDGLWTHIPLVRRERVIGLMSVVSKPDTHPPLADRLFSALAGYAAYVVENSVLRSILAAAAGQEGPTR
jgi:two-component system NtrC family sensor kinase